MSVPLLQPVLIAILLALPAAGHGPSASTICEGMLTAKTDPGNKILRQRLRNTIITRIPSGGFEVRNSVLSDKNQATTEIVLENLHFGKDQWRNEEWIYDGAHYSFLDLGFKDFESDSQEVHRLVIDHVREKPEAELRIVFGPQRVGDLRKRTRLRWATHDVVLEVYKESKNYLGWADFSIMKHVNRSTGNSDVLTLLRYDPDHATWSNLDAVDVHERLVSTAQVSYYGDPVILAPTAKSLAAAQNPLYAGIAHERKFPFEYRVDHSESAQIHHHITSMFDPLKTCEITRFASRASHLPRPVMHRLLSEVFDTLVKRGMKVILASLDDKTFRLFRREYGFQRLFEFPVKGNQEHETLAFLFVDTQLFEQVREKLQKSGMQVEVRRIND